MDIGPIIGAALTGGALATVLQFFRDRKTNQSKTRVQIATEKDQVEIASTGRLQAQQVYLQNFIDGQERQINALQKDLIDERNINQTQRARIFELENQIQALKLQAQDMEHRCDLLQNQLAQIKNGS